MKILPNKDYIIIFQDDSQSIIQFTEQQNLLLEERYLTAQAYEFYFMDDLENRYHDLRAIYYYKPKDKHYIKYKASNGDIITESIKDIIPYKC